MSKPRGRLGGPVQRHWLGQGCFICGWDRGKIGEYRGPAVLVGGKCERNFGRGGGLVGTAPFLSIVESCATGSVIADAGAGWGLTVWGSDTTGKNNGYPTLLWQTREHELNFAAGAGGSTVEAITNPGRMFREWSDGSAENPRLDQNVAADLTITAIFELPGDFDSSGCVDLGDFFELPGGWGTTYDLTAFFALAATWGECL